MLKTCKKKILKIILTRAVLRTPRSELVMSKAQPELASLLHAFGQSELSLV